MKTSGWLVVVSVLVIYSSWAFAGGHVSGGGEKEEKEISVYRDRIRNFVNSVSFPSAILEGADLKVSQFDKIIAMAKITTVEALAPLRDNERPRSMINYWANGVPRIDVLSSDFKKIQSEEERVGIFMHEFLGLMTSEEERQIGQVRIADDNYLTSNDLAKRLLEYESGQTPPRVLQGIKAELFSCYEKLYIWSEAQSDYWSFSSSRTRGNPVDTYPEFAMIPREDDLGAYFISPHEKYPVYSATIRDWGRGGVIFLPDPVKREFDLMSMEGFVLSYFGPQESPGGQGANRFEMGGTNIRKFIETTVLEEGIKLGLKVEDPEKYKELDAAQKLDEYLREQGDKFRQSNGGQNLELYVFTALNKWVDEGFILKDIEPALNAFRDRIAKRIESVPAFTESSLRRAESRIKLLQDGMRDAENVKADIKYFEDLIQSLSDRKQDIARVCGKLKDPKVAAAIEKLFGQKTASLPKKNSVSEVESPTDAKSAEPIVAKRVVDNPVSVIDTRNGNIIDVEKISNFTQPNRKGARETFSYSMPRGDSARQHPGWNDEKTFTVYLYKASPKSSEYSEIKQTYLARAQGKSKFLNMDLNCLHNRRGGILLEKGWEQSMDDVMAQANDKENESRIGFTAQGYWFDFDSANACNRFKDYLNKNGSKITIENPLEITVDDNHFYRVASIKHY